MDELDAKLQRIMTEYRNQPTDKVVSDTIIRTSNDPDRVRRTAAATLGFSRSAYYLDTARSLMDQIVNDVREISWSMNAYNTIFGDLRREFQPTAAEDRKKLEKAAHLKLGARYLSIQAELLWHFYALSLQHAWHFMENSAQIADLGLEKTQKESENLELIRTFRNHMEHRDKAIKNIRSDDWLSMSRREQDAVLLGYRRDHENNIFFVPVKGPLAKREQKMPMNPDGFCQFETLLIGAYERLKAACFKRLEQYFIDHPDQLPLPDQVGATLTEYMDPIERPDT